MKIAVVGAGGVGGYFGGRLAQAGIDTTFIARGATLAALRANGLRVESILGDFTIDNVQATNDPSTIGPVDAIFTTVKSWQLAEAASRLAPLLHAETMVIPLENGIDAPTILTSHIPTPNVLGGLCAIVSYAVAPARIRHAASEPLIAFGELDNQRTPRAERLLDILRSANINAEIPLDIHRSMWTKFLFIAPLSAIGAATRTPIGTWRQIPETRALATAALHEITTLATTRHIDLGPDAVERTLARYDAMDPTATSSLQRDIMAGLPSELDAQLGTVVRLAHESGVAAPVCEMLYGVLVAQEITARQTSTM